MTNRERIDNAQNLDELFSAVQHMNNVDAYCTSLEALPTFGGEPVEQKTFGIDNEGIFSWDEESFLVKDKNVYGGWRVVERATGIEKKGFYATLRELGVLDTPAYYQAKDSANAQNLDGPERRLFIAKALCINWKE